MRTEPPPADRPPDEDGGLDIPREGEGFENRGTLNEGDRPIPEEEEGARTEGVRPPPEKFRRNWFRALPDPEFLLRGEILPWDVERVRLTGPRLRLG